MVWTSGVGVTRSDVLRLVLRQGMALAVWGIGCGTVAALGATRALRKLLFEVAPTDPLTFMAVICFLGLVALLACWLPARRAASVDPMVVLRCE
jgi:putative ABC transport system permease protein